MHSTRRQASRSTCATLRHEHLGTCAWTFLGRVPMFAQARSRLSKSRATFDQHPPLLPELDQTWAKFDRLRPLSATFGLGSTKVGPNSTNFVLISISGGPESAALAGIPPNLGRIRPAMAGTTPIWTELHQVGLELDPISATRDGGTKVVHEHLVG